MSIPDTPLAGARITPESLPPGTDPDRARPHLCPTCSSDSPYVKHLKAGSDDCRDPWHAAMMRLIRSATLVSGSPGYPPASGTPADHPLAVDLATSRAQNTRLLRQVDTLTRALQALTDATERALSDEATPTDLSIADTAVVRARVALDTTQET